MESDKKIYSTAGVFGTMQSIKCRLVSSCCTL